VTVATLCWLLELPQGERLKTRVGTVYYTAPEVWNENYDHSCDLWSAGVIM